MTAAARSAGIVDGMRMCTEFGSLISIADGDSGDDGRNGGSGNTNTSAKSAVGCVSKSRRQR
jgi:hypothetical protein